MNASGKQSPMRPRSFTNSTHDDTLGGGVAGSTPIDFKLRLALL
jgi:hypothetical protein